MPLLKIVPCPDTDLQLVEQAVDYWKYLGKVPVVLGKECTGFVANRLAFALLREVINLVIEGVILVKQSDTIVENSMGPRWAVAGLLVVPHGRRSWRHSKSYE
jgi:3-hydroxyacyl-CoA dehydrogenase